MDGPWPRLPVSVFLSPRSYAVGGPWERSGVIHIVQLLNYLRWKHFIIEHAYNHPNYPAERTLIA